MNQILIFLWRQHHLHHPKCQMLILQIDHLKYAITINKYANKKHTTFELSDTKIKTSQELRMLSSVTINC